MDGKSENLWQTISTPLRKGWALVGQVADHVGRIVLILSIVGLLVTGGAIVIGYLTEMPALITYVAAVTTAVLCLSGAVEVMVFTQRRQFVEQPSSNPSPAPDLATTPKAEKIEKKPERARLSIVPIVVNGEALLRFENEGGQVDVTARLVGVTGFEVKTIPFRMKWVTDNPSFLQASQMEERTQKRLEVGSLASVIVAKTAEYERRVELQMPGGLTLPVPRPASGELGVEVSFASSPPFADRPRRAYVIRVDGHAKIIDFTEVEITPQSGQSTEGSPNESA